MADIAAKSNTRVVEYLYREHSRWLCSWIARQPWTVHAAEDIVSDVFLALLCLPSVSDLREPRAMMMTIAKRLIFDARRRKRLQNDYFDALSVIPEVLDLSAEERMILVQTLELIDELLDTLSPRAKKVFLMSQIDGMPNKEIARVMNISTSTVSKYMTQGFAAVYLAKVRG